MRLMQCMYSEDAPSDRCPNRRCHHFLYHYDYEGCSKWHNCPYANKRARCFVVGHLKAIINESFNHR